MLRPWLVGYRSYSPGRFGTIAAITKSHLRSSHYFRDDCCTIFLSILTNLAHFQQLCQQYSYTLAWLRMFSVSSLKIKINALLFEPWVSYCRWHRIWRRNQGFRFFKNLNLSFNLNRTFLKTSISTRRYRNPNLYLNRLRLRVRSLLRPKPCSN